MVDTDYGRGEHGISPDLEHFHDAAREIPVKHVHGKQMDALRIAQES
jgi:hypothetical protein